MTSFDARTTTVSELQELLRTFKLTSVQLVERYLLEIEHCNKYLRAVISTAPKASLVQRAEKLDEERRAGKCGPLHGIPILVKDNIATHPDLGMGTTAGSLALVNSRPKKNAEIVERLIDAGAIIIGKTNLSELSYFKSKRLPCGWSAVGGQCQSAYVRGGVRDDESPGGHTNPGGSSSGSAIAVSAGLAPISIGTDTSGSLIYPASKAALYSIKPTLKIVSQAGIIPGSSFFDAAGPMAKSVEDLANVMDVIVDPGKTCIPTGGFASCIISDWSSLRVGVLDPSQWELSEEFVKHYPGAEEQMYRSYLRAYKQIERLSKSFHWNVPLPPAETLKVGDELAHRKICIGLFQREIETYLQDLAYTRVHTLQEIVDFNKANVDADSSPRNDIQDMLETALTRPYSEADVARDLTHAWKVARDDGIDKILADYDIDVIIGPADSDMPKMAAAAGREGASQPNEHQGYPIASMPLDYLEYSGRPFGLAAIASAHDDATLIRVQSAWAATFGSFEPPPYEVFSPARVDSTYEILSEETQR
ncbi:amidase signature domain-containing protein [Phaeosphaeriaceae sp. PMI808]|nr:amidase signature domain-containing protein [Phaeosphaeriaceae sp. PMI808]